MSHRSTEQPYITEEIAERCQNCPAVCKVLEYIGYIDGLIDSTHKRLALAIDDPEYHRDLQEPFVAGLGSFVIYGYSGEDDIEEHHDLTNMDVLEMRLDQLGDIRKGNEETLKKIMGSCCGTVILKGVDANGHEYDGVGCSSPDLYNIIGQDNPHVPIHLERFDKPEADELLQNDSKMEVIEGIVKAALKDHKQKRTK